MNNHICLIVLYDICIWMKLLNFVTSVYWNVNEISLISQSSDLIP